MVLEARFSILGEEDSVEGAVKTDPGNLAFYL